MYRQAFPVLMLFLISVSQVQSAVADNEIADIAYLRRLVARDPVKDAQDSIAKGSLRFLGVAGYVVHVPGVDTDKLIGCTAILERVDVIRGTSDALMGKEHSDLIEKARTYAFRYNSLVAKHRRFKLPSNCGTPNKSLERIGE